MPRAGRGGGVAPPRSDPASLSTPPSVPNRKSLESHPFGVCTEASLHRRDGFNLWPLVTDPTSSLCPLPEGQEVGPEVPTL